MKPKHTPGPWFSSENLNLFAETGEHLADLDTSTEELPSEQIYANARLIAAAPDLLAALVEMIVLYADHAQYDDEEGHETAGINAARTAIAKATT